MPRIARRARVVLSLALCAPLACAHAQPQRPSGRAPAAREIASLPRVFALRPEALRDAKARVAAKDASLAPALDKLRRDADRALKAPLIAVTDKQSLLPPTGDKHDYFSLSPYWWPDPSKADGLPYIRRDGETNPESKRDLDQPRVAAMGGNVHTLALAFYLSGEDAYAERAAAQIRTWFLDPATRMNPHLRFAQLVRGNDAERGSGIIDTRWFIETVDAIGMLHGSKHWTDADQRGMQQWFGAYLTWLRTSPNGKHEHDAKNNHGSWYAAQTTSYALFTGDTAGARETLAGIPARIGWQITAAGEQPIELERTRSYHYSGFNVEALSRLAEMGRQLGVDLWTYQAPEGGSIRRASDRLAQYSTAMENWPGKQIDTPSLDDMILIMRRTQTAVGSPVYAPTLTKLPATQVQQSRSALLYPDAR